MIITRQERDTGKQSKVAEGKEMEDNEKDDGDKSCRNDGTETEREAEGRGCQIEDTSQTSELKHKRGNHAGRNSLEGPLFPESNSLRSLGNPVMICHLRVIIYKIC